MNLKKWIWQTKQKYNKAKTDGFELRTSLGGRISEKGTTYLPEDWEPFKLSMLSLPPEELKKKHPLIYFFKTYCNTNNEFWMQVASGNFGVFVIGSRGLFTTSLTQKYDEEQKSQSFKAEHRTNGKINLRTFQLNSHFSSELVTPDITYSDWTGFNDEEVNSFQTLRLEKFRKLCTLKNLHFSDEFFTLYDEVYKRSSGWTWLAVKRHLNEYGQTLWKECFNGTKSPTKFNQIVHFIQEAMKKHIFQYKFKTSLNSVWGRK